MSIKDATLVTVVVVLWLFTIHYAYTEGVEKGYWEHEAEENTYNCQVMT